MKVPDIMDIYVRQYALAHNIYCDEDDVTAQLYLFRPAGLYKYQDLGVEGGQLNWTPISYDVDVKVWIAHINQALENWRNSSDLALISGTIQRAFSEMDTISLDYVFETDIVVPTVDRNIIWQINNATITPLKSGASMNITQDPIKNTLIFDPLIDLEDFNHVLPIHQDCHVLNSYDGETGDEFIMEATRLIVFRDEEVGGFVFPTEIITGGTLWYSQDKIGGGSEFKSEPFYQSVGFKFTNTNENFLELYNFTKVCGLISQFKYHPLITIWDMGDEETKWTLLARIGDLYKFTTIDNSALKGLYLAATQSVYRTVNS